ncbi:MAG: hypothetical protein KAY32_12290 [Candidatus Eisenbacteria sp.]|nr:hypothetical protein [Candidatus Eisenbacteria bacterium]
MYARTSISLPQDLKERMDGVAEPVNWSALACQAFQDKLAEIAGRKERMEMDDVVERLRASRQKSDSEQSGEGYAAGQVWARKQAEAVELERLDSLDTRLERELLGWSGFLDCDSNSAYGPEELLYFEMHPDEDRDRTAATDFWEMTTGMKVSDGLPKEFIRGFVEGALSIWHQVEDKL